MMFYLIAVSLSLGLIGLAAVTGKIKVVSPTPIPTQPHSPEKNKPLPSPETNKPPQSYDPYHPRSEGENNIYRLPRCSDDVCECGWHKYMNFGPDGPPEH